MSPVSPIVISTQLPPRICGVGTYSWLLEKYRPSDSVAARFFVMDGACESRATLGFEEITDFHGNPRTLANALDRSGRANVLLHYAGRAYQRYGCPIWLPRVLRKWKAKFPGSRFTVFFHEVPGKLPAMSRHFVLGKLNRRIIRQLAGLADVVITNTDDHARNIRTMSGRNPVHCLPVGSNIELIGDPAQPRIGSDFVVFGLPFSRLQILKSFATQITRWREEGLLSNLHLIGPEDDKMTAETAPFLKMFAPFIVHHGALPDDEVSQLLLRVKFALTNATRATWSKSGVFMACAAHGCAVVMKDKESEPPLCYTVAEDEVGNISSGEIENRSSLLKEWSEENVSWPLMAKRLAFLWRCHPSSRDE